MKAEEEIRKLIAYKYTFLSRKQYLTGIIDEKIRRLKIELEYEGIDADDFVRRVEKRYARQEDAQ